MRLQTETIIPVGDNNSVTDANGKSVTVPTGASGVVLMPTVAGQTYTVSFTGAITDRDTQGLALPNGLDTLNEYLFWFDPVHVPTIYTNISGGRLRYQFVTVR